MTDKGKQSYCMRPMALDDVGTVSLWFEDLVDLSRFDRGSPVPINREAVAESWKLTLTASEPRQGYWFSIDNADGEIVGIAGLEKINYVNGDGVIAVFLAEKARRRGLGTQALGVLLDLAFDQLRLNRVTSYYRSDHEATQKLTKAAGFSKEGVLRQAWYASGSFFDIIVIGILAKEWPESRKRIANNLSGLTELKFGRPPWVARVWPAKLM